MLGQQLGEPSSIMLLNAHQGTEVLGSTRPCSHHPADSAVLHKNDWAGTTARDHVTEDRAVHAGSGSGQTVQTLRGAMQARRSVGVTVFCRHCSGCIQVGRAPSGSLTLNNAIGRVLTP